MGGSRFADRNLQAQRRRADGLPPDVLTRIVNGHPNNQIDDLLPWSNIRSPELKAVAFEHRLRSTALELPDGSRINGNSMRAIKTRAETMEANPPPLYALSARQFRLDLHANGLLASVQSSIDALDEQLRKATGTTQRRLNVTVRSS